MPGGPARALALPLLLLLATGVTIGGGLVAGSALGAGPAASARAADTSTTTPTPTASAPEAAAEPNAADAPSASPSAAPGSPAPSDPPTTTAPPTPPAIADPQISNPSSGDTLAGRVTVSGSAEPGSDIQVLSSTQSDPLCTIGAGSDGSFSCSTSSLPSGPSVQLTVVQLVDGYSDERTSVTVNVLNAPTLQSGSNGSVSTGYGTVRGSAYPGATVTATASAYSCSGVADGSGSWACNLGTGIPSGTLRVNATQTTGWSNGPSPASDSLTLQIDSTTPAPPVIASPSAGTTVSSVSQVAGTGEDGALVTVFAGSFAACTTTVHGTSWSCTTGAVPAGAVGISAIQQDAAGNVSDESVPFTVTFTAAGTPTPSTSPGASSGSAGGAATGAGTPPAATGGAGSPTAPASGGAGAGAGGSGTGSAGGDSGGTDNGDTGSASPASPGSPGDGGAAAAVVPQPGSWASATRFTAALQPVLAAAPLTTWLVALAVALAAIALIAAPGRLLAAAMARSRARRADALVTPASSSPASFPPASFRPVSSLSAPMPPSPPRGASRAAQAVVTRRPRGAFDAARTRALQSRLSPTRATPSRLTGRNRPAGDFDSAFEVTFNPWLIAGASVLLSAAIGLLSGPVAGQPAYLRLYLAIAVAFAALNAAAVVLPRVLARRWLGVGAQIVLSPRYLLVAVGLALVSRLLDLQPALLFGIVLALVPTIELSRRQAARLAGLQLGSLLGLGTVAWLALVWLPGIAGANATANPLAALANETLTTIVLGSFAATAVLVLPFGSLAGRAVYDWSKPIWLGLTVVSFTLLAAVVAPSFEQSGRGFALAQTVLIAVTFAAVSLSVWVWITYIAPTLDE